MRKGWALAFATVVSLVVSAGCAYAGEHAAQCLVALVPLAADAVPASEDFATAACPKKIVRAAFRYDRTKHYTRITRAIDAGEIVSRYPEFGAEMIRPGQSLILVVSQGPVRVAQAVEALQPARSGERLFVKTAEGQILSARYEKVLQ